MFAKHEFVAIDEFEKKVKQLDTLKKVTLYCSLHQGKELELYCETCEELICHNCTVSKHCRPEHKYDLVDDTLERHKAEITASLDPVEEQLSVVCKAQEQLEVRSHDLTDQRASIEASIHQQIQKFIELLLAREAQLVGELDQVFQVKIKNLEVQKDELATVHTQLASCLSFVRDSLRTGSKGEVMKMKKAVMKQMKEMTDKLKPDMLPPCEPANIVFTSSPELSQACQQFGKVFQQIVAPKKCYATGKGLETAEPGERATAVLHVVDHKEEYYTTPVETVTCELVSEIKIDCSVKETEASQYEISYQPTSRGRHQLHIKVEGEHIRGSPFPVTVKLPVQKLGTPIKTVSGVNKPWSVAINQRCEVVVAECSGRCVSIFSPTGEKLRLFGSQGLGDERFNRPLGVAVDDDGNILVVDNGNCRIQKFTSDGKFITAVGKCGNEPLEFRHPTGIAIHPINKKVYVADNSNHRIQSLNPDLTFSNTFGSCGNDNEQFLHPWDLAFDSTGRVYVAEYKNNRIQVFTAEGKYLRQFGRYGSGNGELYKPSSISIDSNDVVYVTEDANHRVSVFTCEGKFLTSFGTKGTEPGQFNEPRGIAVDKNGVIYVSDYGNSRLQYF